MPELGKEKSGYKINRRDPSRLEIVSCLDYINVIILAVILEDVTTVGGSGSRVQTLLCIIQLYVSLRSLSSGMNGRHEKRDYRS